MNKGISEDLILFFPDTCAISRPVVTNKEIPDPNWVVGFTDGVRPKGRVVLQ